MGKQKITAKFYMEIMKGRNNRDLDMYGGIILSRDKCDLETRFGLVTGFTGHLHS
jgi:hypothetical protein